MTSAGRGLRPLETRVRQLLQDGDLDAAATAVIEALTPGVRRYLSRTLPADDAQDVVSLFSEDVWRGLPGFRWECSLRAWAHRVAWRAVARFGRDRYRRRKEPLASVSRLAAPAAAASGMGGRHDQLAKLHDELPAEERTLLVLRIRRGLGWEEVSAALAAEGEEISAAALRKRFERLKNKLAELARERGLLAGGYVAVRGSRCSTAASMPPAAARSSRCSAGSARDARRSTSPSSR